ncbi:MAG: glutaredoxin family protein [Thiogranum sp.]
MSCAPVHLTLYYREGCHLCETMLQALRGLQSRLGFELSRVDIDADPDLRRRYDEWVPVLCYREQELCHYYLDERRVVEVCR